MAQHLLVWHVFETCNGGCERRGWLRAADAPSARSEAQRRFNGSALAVSPASGVLHMTADNLFFLYDGQARQALSGGYISADEAMRAQEALERGEAPAIGGAEVIYDLRAGYWKSMQPLQASW